MFNNKFTKKDPVADVVSQIIGESWDDDDEDDDVRRADAELKRMKAKPIEADKKTDPDKEIGKLAKKTPKEVDEETEVNEDKWTDVADGPWKKSNRTKEQGASAAANAAGKGLKDILKKKMKKEESEQIDELSIPTMGSYFQKSLSQKLSGKKDRTPGMQKAYKKMTTKKPTVEEVEQIDELSKKTLANYMRANTKRMADPKNPDSMERKMKRHDDYFKASEKFHKEETVNEAQGPTSDYGVDPNFVPPANTSSSPVTPLQRIKSLAAAAKHRLNDSMLGQAGNTSEEVDPNVKSTDMLRGRTNGGKKDDVGPGADFKSTKVKFTPGPK